MCSSEGHHAGVQRLVRDLNRLYRDEPALWEVRLRARRASRGSSPTTRPHNVLAFARLSRDRVRPRLVCVANFSPRAARPAIALGLPAGGPLDARCSTRTPPLYGGSGAVNAGVVVADEIPWHEQPYSAELTLPPLGVVWLRAARD